LAISAFALLAFARVQVENFGPAIPYTTESDYPEIGFFSAPSPKDPLEIAMEFIKVRVPTVNGLGYELKSHYTTDHNKVSHAYFKQTLHGLEVVNGDFAVHVDSYGRVVSFSNSFYLGDLSFEQQSNQLVIGANDITPKECVMALAAFLKTSRVPVESEIVETAAKDDGSLFAAGGVDESEPVFLLKNVPFADKETVLMVRKFIIVNEPEYALRPVWDTLFEMENGDNYFNIQVDAQSANVVQVIDWVHEAKYYVYPIGVNDPLDGPQTMVSNPEDNDASPLGWHNLGADVGRGKGEDGAGRFRNTIGNNVAAQPNHNFARNTRPDGTGELGDLTFNYPADLSKDPNDYVNASVTNLFYWNNIVHDIFYHYGFDEKSGNFQENNFGRGGREGDSVVANAQDGSGTNNANFMTPPDGQKPRMRMYIWTLSTPRRDGDLEAGIIVHEYGHGISIRLTGGPMNSGCLPYGESGGMGEGWGDFWATLMRMRKEYNGTMDFAMGDYSATRGIRPFPYSRSLTTNPQTYGYIKKNGYGGVHAKGAVWASILYEVYWSFVDAYGFNEDWYAIKEKKFGKEETLAGNLIILQLIVDGLKLQPCRPTFVDARDAIIKADETGFEGKHVCLLWTAFAKRGLGYSAKAGGIEAFDLPKECQ